MGRNYWRIYRQDVRAELDDGTLIVSTDHIDSDLPSTHDEIDFVELDGSVKKAECVGWELALRVKGSA